MRIKFMQHQLNSDDKVTVSFVLLDAKGTQVGNGAFTVQANELPGYALGAIRVLSFLEK